MRLFLNGLAANAGAGLTYIRNVIPHLSASSEVHTTVAISATLRNELGSPPNVSFVEIEAQRAGKRFWREQTELAHWIRQHQADVLISAGNFAVRRSPVPQILLSGNSLYTSPDFYRDLQARREYRMWLDTGLRGFFAKRSVRWADRTVAPSEAFAADLRKWTGSPNIISIYHGFDHDAFCRDQVPLPASLAEKLAPEGNTLRLLFVSHYNYYRNFETLFRALPLLKCRLSGTNIRLFLTCKLNPGANPGSYDPAAAAKLLHELGISQEVVELDAVPYQLLHHVYRSCNIYVTAAYAETFAHPLVEAMASGLPVVASGLPVHREVCGKAALYFERFSPESLAEQVAGLASNPKLAQEMGERGLTRSRDFSWRDHVKQIVSLAHGLLRGESAA